MKLKYKFSIFNAVSKMVPLVVLWFILPFVVEKVIHSSVNSELKEKKSKFVKHLDRKEINDFLATNNTDEVYGSFSTLHNEFIQLYADPEIKRPKADVFLTEMRKIENEDSNYRILRHYFVYNKTTYVLEIGSRIDEIDSLKHLLRLYLIITFFLVALISYFIDNYYIEKLLRPFYKIIETKLRVGNDPDKFNYNPVETGIEEFRELDKALNEMMDRVTTLFKRKKQYMSNVSHELLTPIALLKNRFENLIQNKSFNDDAIDKIADSMKILDVLKQIINNMLLISKIESDHFSTDETIHIDGIITDLLEILDDRIQSRHLAVTKSLTHELSFTGNVPLIRIMISNFLTNAIKYNKNHGSITISDMKSENFYSLIISDTGIGMDEAQQKDIFERFIRVSFTEEGHGLGLAIAESIANLHRIGIEVQSAPGLGTAFTLHFPVP